MPSFQQNDPANEEAFSWEAWLKLGMRALKKTLSRYHLGMPDAFWQHLENAFSEFLAAMRIALQTLRQRRQGQRASSQAHDSAIPIEWDDEDWD